MKGSTGTHDQGPDDIFCHEEDEVSKMSAMEDEREGNDEEGETHVIV